MKISARNQITGKVVEVKDGVVTAQVTVDIGGGNTIVSSITLDSVKTLGLAAGKEVTVIIKASDVMLGA
ncbi:TOBE domain-containing protein [Thalassospiraceae bacterium LMO-SO8]|nr:TOBE domain-containing protein [Alphaproteobacteria bacterium LMO-S08]WND74560.1 TOBE domain-containing protein [Thalassospiraceae bacterium LMO-SO8]